MKRNKETEQEDPQGGQMSSRRNFVMKFFSSRRRHTRFKCDWSSDVCSSDLSSDSDVQAIVSYIDATGTIEGAPHIKPEHLAVFDCSFKPAKGTRSIHYLGHLKMMAATQPFLSGAISKTVNLPHECTIEDIAETYVEAWRLGLKAVAIYRDGSKGVQVLNTSNDEKKK